MNRKRQRIIDRRSRGRNINLNNPVTFLLSTVVVGSLLVTPAVMYLKHDYDTKVRSLGGNVSDTTTDAYTAMTADDATNSQNRQLYAINQHTYSKSSGTRRNGTNNKDVPKQASEKLEKSDDVDKSKPQQKQTESIAVKPEEDPMNPFNASSIQEDGIIRKTNNDPIGWLIPKSNNIELNPNWAISPEEKAFTEEIMED